MSILEDLHWGIVGTPERPASYWHKTNKIGDQIEAIRAKLIATLSEEQIELLEQLEDCIEDRTQAETLYSFITGYRLATRTMAEVFLEE